MGCTNSKIHDFPEEVMWAFEKRFMTTQYEEDDKDAYTPFYVFVYDLAFFLRNDQAQTSVERCIQKISQNLVPTPEDWMKYTLRLVDFFVSTGRLTKYGHPRFPILLGVAKRI
jgi:hypothetical protein